MAARAWMSRYCERHRLSPTQLATLVLVAHSFPAPGLSGVRSSQRGASVPPPIAQTPASSLGPSFPVQRQLPWGRLGGGAGPNGEHVPPGCPWSTTRRSRANSHVVFAGCPRQRAPLGKGFRVGPCDLVCGDGLSWLWFLSLFLCSF